MAHFKIRLLVYLLFSFESFAHFGKVSYQMHVCSNIFSQSESCFAFCFDIAFCRADSLNLNGVLFTNHSFTGFVLCVTPRSHHNPKGIYIFFYVTLRGFIFLNFTFTSMIHFELTYMKDIVSMSRFTILH